MSSRVVASALAGRVNHEPSLTPHPNRDARLGTPDVGLPPRSALDRPPGGNNTPALSIDLDFGDALRRVDEDPFDLLRRQTWIRFQHAGTNRRNNRRREGSSIDVLIVAADYVPFTQLDRDQLPY